MDDYSTKIKTSAEHLIRNEFPEKALELDTLVSVNTYCFICQIKSNDDYFSRVQYYPSVKYHKSVQKFNYQPLTTLCII